MDWITNPEIWVALLTLTVLEIVLGIDNIVFISILSEKLPAEQQEDARRIGLGVALITRVLLLLSLSWIIQLEEPLFHIFDSGISGRDLILISGGLFLLGKSTYEIHEKLEGDEGHASARIGATFTSVIVQIMLLDMVFSLDSVITAVGMVDSVGVMIAAVVIAMILMLFAVNGISNFVNRHPTVKILALSFLLLIGFSLIVEGIHVHIPKGYIYFAMAFSIFVELINLRLRRSKEKPLELRQGYTKEA